MKKKLWRVRVVFDGLVYASSKSQAIPLGSKMAGEGILTSIEVTPWPPEGAKSFAKALPSGWKMGSIPWGAEENKTVGILLSEQKTAGSEGW